MKIGFVGLGKMGFLLAKQLVDAGIEVVGWDLDPSQGQKFIDVGGTTVGNLHEMIGVLDGQSKVWIMVPAGEAVDNVINEILPSLKKGDIIIDGGNSYFKDSIRRSESLKEKGIEYLDCGTSGGLEGAAGGACLMVGGKKEAVESCKDLFKILAMENGYLYCGKSGSGHFVKMVHNGIEYGMMQAIAEGFEMMHSSDFDINLEKVARLWSNGSVIRGWLMDLTGNALQKDAHLDGIKGVMHNSGEGKWTAQTAIDMEVPAPIITQSLQMRFRSKQQDTFSGKVVAALRNEFGGHAVEKSGEN
jgi:6-phosphogluconate dehydrogenase